MSYREIHELFVVCDECHTSLSVDDATYEDADNEAVDHGCSDSNGHSARTPPKSSTRNGIPHPNGSATDTCAKPSKCSPPPTKRNQRAPRPPATRTACVSNTAI